MWRKRSREKYEAKADLDLGVEKCLRKEGEDLILPASVLQAPLPAPHHPQVQLQGHDRDPRTRGKSKQRRMKRQAMEPLPKRREVCSRRNLCQWLKRSGRRSDRGADPDQRGGGDQELREEEEVEVEKEGVAE